VGCKVCWFDKMVVIVDYNVLIDGIVIVRLIVDEFFWVLV